MTYCDNQPPHTVSRAKDKPYLCTTCNGTISRKRVTQLIKEGALTNLTGGRPFKTHPWFRSPYGQAQFTTPEGFIRNTSRI